jgi:hypothetical protein
LLKDTKKWETSYTLSRKLEDVNKKGNGNSSIDGTIDLKYDGQNLGVPSTEEAGGGGRAKRPVGHKATKTDMHRQASSLAFQDTLRELMIKKEEAIPRGKRGDAKRKRQPPSALLIFNFELLRWKRPMGSPRSWRPNPR